MLQLIVRCKSWHWNSLISWKEVAFLNHLSHLLWRTGFVWCKLLHCIIHYSTVEQRQISSLRDSRFWVCLVQSQSTVIYWCHSILTKPQSLHQVTLLFFIIITNLLLILDDIRELLADIKFSEKGSSARQKEEATYIYFTDYLEECERGKVWQMFLFSLVYSNRRSRDSMWRLA